MDDAIMGVADEDSKKKAKQAKNILRTLQNHLGTEPTSATATFAKLLAQNNSELINVSRPASSSNQPMPNPIPMETGNSSQERVDKNKKAYAETGTPNGPKKRKEKIG